MNVESTAEPQALEHRMKVKFDVDELNGFYRTFAPLDLDELWAVLDGEDEDTQS